MFLGHETLDTIMWGQIRVAHSLAQMCKVVTMHREDTNPWNRH